MRDPGKVLDEFDRMAQLELWPTFDPHRIPLALYDGQRTLLLRHPRPPQGFRELPEPPGVCAFEGQHPSVRANTSIELEGIPTATLLLDETRSAEELAATLLHEAFHVFQRERHPDWCANEAELFVYPVEDVDVLRTRWLETEALRRALAERDLAQAAKWAACALEIRRERFRTLPEGSVAYERGTELNEGLAQYIESLALGKPISPLPEEVAAEEVRLRGYAVGHALALLLDRLDPAWKGKLEAEEASSLDELLQATLDRLGIRPARFTQQDQENALSWAKSEAERLRARREALRGEFSKQPGWRIVIEAEEPLWPQGFDPMNVHRLGEKEVLHTRWLKLGNEAGTLEILDRPCLTEAAGEHPLFHGVRRVVITGLPIATDLGVGSKSGVVSIRTEGVKVEFRAARIERADQSLILHVHKSPESSES